MAKLLPFHLKCNLYTQAPQGRFCRYKVMVLQHILRSIFVLLAFQSVHIGPCDLMDKGSDFGSGDYRFESCHGQCLLVRNLWCYGFNLMFKPWLEWQAGLKNSQFCNVMKRYVDTGIGNESLPIPVCTYLFITSCIITNDSIDTFLCWSVAWVI